MRTRVGYSGGISKDPTYRSLGDHAETIQIDFDPRRISYAELLEVFCGSHNPCARPPSVRPSSRQYMSAIFYHDELQQRLAETAMQRVAKARGVKVHTLVAKAGTFYLAEDYHQKHELRRHKELVAEYLAVYPGLGGFVNSTATTRVNGYLGGHGSLAGLRRDLPRLGLSASAAGRLLEAGERGLPDR